VLDELIPRGVVAIGIGHEALVLLLGGKGRRKGTGIAQVQGEKKDLVGEGVQEHMQHHSQPFVVDLLKYMPGTCFDILGFGLFGKIFGGAGPSPDNAAA